MALIFRFFLFVLSFALISAGIVWFFFPSVLQRYLFAKGSRENYVQQETEIANKKISIIKNDKSRIKSEVDKFEKKRSKKK